jgi:hypothetical protein
MDACADCKKVWEPLPAGCRVEPDEPYFAFDEMCDNCAFRKNSPEREDKGEWLELQFRLFDRGGQFYCHKGVPFTLGTDGSHGEFEFLKKPDGSHDQEKMRLCRGYLNTLKREIRKGNY